MKPSRNIPLILVLAVSACIEPKPGSDRLAPGDASTNEDAVANADANAKADAQPDATSPGDSGGTADATSGDATDPDAEPVDMGVDAGEPSCVPTGPEDCTNGLDDDCQNGIDCADRACGQCLAVPAPFTAGVFVDANVRCPPGFEVGETPVFAGLDPGPGCAGTCSCTANPIRCLGQVYVYSTNAQCMADVALTGGMLSASTIDAMCTTTPIFDGFAGGFRLGNWTVEQTCSSAGTASPSPYSWMEQKKLCVAQLGIHGCPADNVCVFSANAASACLMTAGGTMCPGPFTDRSTQYYAGLSDTRSCGACECTASGGSCQFAQIAIGNDWTCTDEQYLSQQFPQACNSQYSPPARVTGSPQDPTCSSFSLEDGELRPTDQQTLCCLP